MTTEQTIPNSVNDWIKNLENRPGWDGWQSAGGNLESGVQNWSTKGDPQSAVGVWGNVEYSADYPYDESEPSINWCAYLGDCREPAASNFESAEAAMDWVQTSFPAHFDPRAEACAYCGRVIPAEDVPTVPAPDDDDEWEWLADQHKLDCEWITTRAHRLELTHVSA